MKRLIPFLLVLALLAASIAAQQGMGPGPGLGKPPGAAGSDFVVDTFTEASDVALASHTGETGATWTVHPSYSAGMTVDSATDRIFPTGTTAYIASGVPPSANHCAEADYCNRSTVSANIGVTLRMSDTVDTMYIFRLNSGTSWEWVSRITGGNGTIGASGTNSLPTAGGACVLVTACVSGTALTVSFDNVHDATMDRTDSSISGTGRVGFRASTGVTSSTGFHLDNFKAR
jgi:hypothetical protein